MVVEDMANQNLITYPDPLVEAYLDYLKIGTDYTSALNKDRLISREKIRVYVAQKVKEALCTAEQSKA